MKKFKKILTDMRRTEKVQVRKYTRSKFGNFLFFAFLFLFGAFSVLPLIYSIATSFKPLDEILVFPPAMFTVKRPTLNNYLALPNLISGLNVPFSRYLTNSLFISIVGTVLHVLAATAADGIGRYQPVVSGLSCHSGHTGISACQYVGW